MDFLQFKVVDMEKIQDCGFILEIATVLIQLPLMMIHVKCGREVPGGLQR